MTKEIKEIINLWAEYKSYGYKYQRGRDKDFPKQLSDLVDCDPYIFEPSIVGFLNYLTDDKRGAKRPTK